MTEPEQVHIRLFRRHPPLKHHPTRARHDDQVAVPRGRARAAGQRAVWTMVGDEFLGICQRCHRAGVLRALLRVRPTLLPGPRATACVPIRSRSRSSASAPSRSCRRSPASLGHRTESIADRSLGGASRPRRALSQTRSRAMSAAPRGHGRKAAWEARRIRVLPAGVGRARRANVHATAATESTSRRSS